MMTDVQTVSAAQNVMIASYTVMILAGQRFLVKMSIIFLTYLLLRGEDNMRALSKMSPQIALVTDAFDEIGWGNIMHRRLFIHLRHLQQQHCTARAANHLGVIG